MIRAILFDFGNVIGFFDHRKATARFASAARMPEEHMFSAIYQGDLEHQFEAGKLTPDQFVTHVINMIGYGGSTNQFCQDFVDIFAPNPPVMDLIPKLKSKYRIVLASNTNALHSAFFRRSFAAVLEHFDALGMSFEAGVRKPDTRFYQHCAALAGASPEECLFVDDVAVNVEGARAAGMKAIQYLPSVDLPRALAEHGIELN